MRAARSAPGSRRRAARRTRELRMVLATFLYCSSFCCALILLVLPFLVDPSSILDERALPAAYRPPVPFWTLCGLALALAAAFTFLILDDSRLLVRDNPAPAKPSDSVNLGPAEPTP